LRSREISGVTTAIGRIPEYTFLKIRFLQTLVWSHFFDPRYLHM